MKKYETKLLNFRANKEKVIQFDFIKKRTNSSTKSEAFRKIIELCAVLADVHAQGANVFVEFPEKNYTKLDLDEIFSSDILS